LLRDKVLKIIPDNVDIFKIKQEFRHLVPAKRRFERINNIWQLVQELERQLIIFPDKGGIQHFHQIISLVNVFQPNIVGPNLVTEVEDLTKRLEPPPILRSRNVSTSSTFSQDPTLFNRVPSHIKEMLVQELERSGGKDWEHFATGLGYDLKDRNKIRIKQGEVDRLELEHNGDVEQILLAVITKFEDRCIQRRVNVKMLDHIIDLLKKREVFGTPFNKLAKQIEEEKNNF